MANYIKGTKIQENSISETKLDSSLQSWKETVTNHINNNDNPHNITKSSIGLDNVTNDAQVKRSELGVANGVATLDSTGKVPSGQLPSYVDDVIEGYLYNGVFYKDTSYTTSIVGESGKIYIDLPTNKTYRWTGSVYGVISETIALGETPSTAYRGDRGKIAYDHSQSAHAPSNAQANVIETIKVNGTALTPNSKAVDITIPTVGNGTITIKQSGTSKGTFTTNQNGNTTIELTDTNTTYTAGDGLSLSGTTFSNNGVRSIATGTTNGTISVNTNGNISNIGVYGLKSAAYTNSSDYAAASHTHTFDSLTSKPTTISGYGITDALTNKYISYKADFQHYVILLCQIGTNSTKTYHTINGTFWTSSGGSTRYQAAYINVHCADWSTNHNEYYGFTPFGLGTKCRLVTCTYQSGQYLAITFENTQGSYIYFDGSYSNILFSPILYYTSDTNTVENSEIYNSISEVTYYKIPLISSTETTLTSSNYNSYALPLSGGTLTKTGTEDIPLVLKTSSATTWLKFQSSDNENRYIGVSNKNEFYFQYGGTSKTVIHSGNYNSYAPKLDGTGASGTWGISISGNADTIDGYHADSFAKKLYLGTTDLNSIDDSLLGQQSGNANATPELHYPVQEAGGLISILSAYNSTNQIYGTFSSNRWFARGAGTGLSSRTSWREFAFLDSNVASATKLQNSRTIWGQSFDGTGNVSGAISGATSITASGDVSTTGNLKIGDYSVSNPTLSIVDTNYGTWKIQVKPGYMQIGYGDGPLCINGNGNVGIGTISPSSKLHVVGDGYFTENVITESDFSSRGNAIIDGRVGIGTSSPAYNLDVDGNMRITGPIRLNVPNSNEKYYISTEYNGLLGITYEGRYQNPAFLMNNLGYVYLNCENPLSPAYPLVVNGTIECTKLLQTSDIKYKTNIKQIEYEEALKIIENLNPVTWDWNENTVETGSSSGFVAQEAEEFIPNAISRDNENNLSLDYTQLHSYEIRVIQEQQKEIKDLKQRLEVLESLVLQLTNREI